MNNNMITVSFGEFDQNIYEYVKSKKNTSAFIRHIIADYMMRELSNNKSIIQQSDASPNVKNEGKKDLPSQNPSFLQKPKNEKNEQPDITSLY